MKASELMPRDFVLYKQRPVMVGIVDGLNREVAVKHFGELVTAEEEELEPIPINSTVLMGIFSDERFEENYIAMTRELSSKKRINIFIDRRTRTLELTHTGVFTRIDGIMFFHELQNALRMVPDGEEIADYIVWYNKKFIVYEKHE